MCREYVLARKQLEGILCSKCSDSTLQIAKPKQNSKIKFKKHQYFRVSLGYGVTWAEI